MTPETPSVAETANFLRRFAGMMSVGHNANYLHHAAVLLEAMALRLAAAQDEEQIWRYKYETIAQHVDLLEAECEALKHDIDGHLNIISSTLSERDALAATLQGREAEFAALRDDLERAQNELAAQSEVPEATLAELRDEFGREREALKAAAERTGEEFEQFRLASEREREEFKAKLAARDAEMSGLLLNSGRERDELNARLKVSGDELAALRTVSERERDALLAKVAALEAKRAEIRSAFDRISHLQSQTAESRAGADNSIAAIGEADVVVPRATLRQVRSQFEHLAHEFTGAGDVASQVMCELGAFTMDLALGAGRKTDSLPVGDVARSILELPGSIAPASAGTI